MLIGVYIKFHKLFRLMNKVSLWNIELMNTEIHYLLFLWQTFIFYVSRIRLIELIRHKIMTESIIIFNAEQKSIRAVRTRCDREHHVFIYNFERLILFRNFTKPPQISYSSLCRAFNLTIHSEYKAYFIRN